MVGVSTRSEADAIKMMQASRRFRVMVSSKSERECERFAEVGKHLVVAYYSCSTVLGGFSINDPHIVIVESIDRANVE